MRILMVTASLPYPLASGGAIRAFGILDGLHQAGHQITLLSFADSTPHQALTTRCEKIIIADPPPARSSIQRLKTLLFSREADLISRYHSPDFAQKLKTLIETDNFDCIQFEGIEAATYLPMVRTQFPEARICFDTFNAEADLQAMMARIKFGNFRQWPSGFYSWLQSKRLAVYEGQLCRMADLVIAVSQEDAELLNAYISPENSCFVVPSGIFSADYASKGAIDAADLGDRAIVFTGKMDYRPNVDAMLWFTDQIWPKLKNASLWIVGQQPETSIQQLASHEGIHVTGWVDSVQPYLKAAHVYIAPLRMGSGTRLKILEAMASGSAIVATSIAASGLLPEARASMIIVNDAEGFAEAIQLLLNDPQQRLELGQRARAAVNTHYDWQVLLPRLFAAYQRLNHGSS